MSGVYILPYKVYRKPIDLRGVRFNEHFLAVYLETDFDMLR